ncbi:hypothetical protein B0A48_00847 [Cryoendolithus antarcticus]|uniref:DUF1996 domain-containing protein n=1 Tax=Cryoendolithus antarcticus TaxID=1507870 RepID=A0A1V8TRY4_9PEZI|nr:hypothetical protein B0A48_00847 [Cryoendolithus antarcticus]
MRNSRVATALALVGSASAFWRMPCRSRTGLARMDPLMDPGEISDHVHSIFGGGNFGMTTTYEDLTQTGGDLNCTSCGVIEDQSAYWTPMLYWQSDDGKTEAVQQVGGMLAYYLLYLDDLKAFPEGFQMIAGSKNVRNFTGSFPDAELSSWPTDPTDQFFLQQRAIGFNCLNYNKAPEPSLYRHQFPDRDYLDANCLSGLRLELAFPSCSNGEKDSHDHKSHMAYPSLVKEGNCPEGYDTHHPFIFYESIFATNEYIGKGGRFVLSYGDPVGTGYHGDFIMGWKSADYLQSAIDDCTNDSGNVQDCPHFTLQDDSDAAKCTFPVPHALKGEDCEGPLDGLPVDVPVQDGPQPATAFPIAGRGGAQTTGLPSTTAETSFALPTLTYSAADPSLTSTAQGGIIVAMYSSGANRLHAEAEPTSSSYEAPTSSYEAPSSTYVAPASLVTESPPIADAAPADDIISTTTYTQGNEVVELYIQEVEVTVTATATAPSKHRRHLHQHVHHQRGARR